MARLVQWLRRYYRHLLVPQKVLKGEAKSYTNQPYCYGSLGFSDIVGFAIPKDTIEQGLRKGCTAWKRALMSHSCRQVGDGLCQSCATQKCFPAPRSLPIYGRLLSSGYNKSWLQAVSLLPLLLLQEAWVAGSEAEGDRWFISFYGLNNLSLDCKFSCRLQLPPWQIESKGLKKEAWKDHSIGYMLPLVYPFP